MKHDNQSKLKLWYNKPADAWIESLPLGNGSLGAMIYGDPFNETIQLNEETVWSSIDNFSINANAQELIKKTQNCILQGNLSEAEVLAKEAYTGTDQGSYQTLGNLMLKFKYNSQKQDVHTYRRELDLSTALSKVRYTIGGATYRIESLISKVDNVFAISIKSTEYRSINVEAELTRPHEHTIKEGKLPLSLVMNGYCSSEKSIKYCAMAKIIATYEGWGGASNAEFKDGKLTVENGSSLVILFTAATNFNNEDAEITCIKRLEAATSKGFENIKKDHIEEYASLFNRVKLSLGEDNLYDFLPTDERLLRVSEGAIDNSLTALYYQYGRYLLISSSRRDSALPANLQGIWNDQLSAPWGSRYTININAQMNYWIAEQGNLSECHEPLFRLIERLKDKGRVTAREMYGCKGFVAHHNTNIWADTTPQDNWPSSTYWSMGAAWLCLHLWQHYEFTLDKDFLSKAYATMKEACEFFVDFLVEDSKGRLVTCPSLSPENIYKTEDGQMSSICAGPTMDSSILRQLFDATINSADILGLSDGFTTNLAKMKQKLPQLEISKNGTIMEWPEDYEETEIGHRHISHLFALYPAGEITVDNTPELAEAARNTLDRRLSNGGGHTGWSCAWIINMWARLWDAENAHKYVHAILAKSTYPNMFDAHPPFQIDGNFGAAAGISEMLLQSNDGVLHLLPALPVEWSDGYLCGVHARGNYEINLMWENKQLTTASIHSCAKHNDSANIPANKKIKIRYNNISSYNVSCNCNPITFTVLDKDTIILDINESDVYVIERK